MKTRLKINPSYSALSDWLSQLPDDFGRGTVIYRGRNEIRRFTAPDGTEFVVKRFGRLPLLRRVIYSTVVRSKASRSFDYGKRYLDLGFNTPEPVASIELLKGGILADAYYVSLYSPAEPLFGPLVKADRFDSALADEVAQLMIDLHAKGAIHGDPNLKNILYNRSDDASVTLSLIDTNRSSFHRHISKRAALKNLMRVSHRRDLMRQIAGRYATLRGLDPIKTVDKVFASLNRFERNRSFRHRLKHIFGIN